MRNAYDAERVEKATRDLLIAIGEDPDREGLVETPARVARSFAEIFGGLDTDPKAHLLKTFNVETEDLVVVKDIEFTSMCEHHLLPFRGVVHVAYLPKKGKVTGLSKLARCVDGYARRPQVQERLTSQIADALEEVLDAAGVGVVIEAEHMCMTIRGVKKSGALTATSSFRGELDDPERRRDVLTLFTT